MNVKSYNIPCILDFGYDSEETQTLGIFSYVIFSCIKIWQTNIFWSSASRIHDWIEECLKYDSTNLKKNLQMQIIQ